MRINQLIAQRNTAKKKSSSELTELKKTVQRQGSFDGFNKRYEPNDEEGEVYPPTSKAVKLKAPEVIREIERIDTEFLNVESSLEASNRIAKANVVIDGEVLLKDVPVTMLLQLEQRFTHYKTILSLLPTLSIEKKWTYDNNIELYRSEETKKHSTKKMQDFKVIVPPTEHHRAEIREITTDKLVGYWFDEEFSGALEPQRKRELMTRIEKLILAVQQAREEANTATSVNEPIAGKVFGYLFK